MHISSQWKVRCASAAEVITPRSSWDYEKSHYSNCSDGYECKLTHSVYNNFTSRTAFSKRYYNKLLIIGAI